MVLPFQSCFACFMRNSALKQSTQNRMKEEEHLRETPQPALVGKGVFARVMSMRKRACTVVIPLSYDCKIMRDIGGLTSAEGKTTLGVG